MKFTWPWYIGALVLMVARNLGYILSGYANVFELFGAYLVDLLIMFLVFKGYEWYKEKNTIERSS